MKISNAKADSPFTVLAMLSNDIIVMELKRAAYIKGLSEFLLWVFSSINKITVKIQCRLNYGFQSEKKNSLCKI